MKLVTVVGTRPQFVKTAVLRLKLREVKDIKETMVDSGQHYDAVLSHQIFKDLKVPLPDVVLSIKRRTHAGMLAEMSLKFEKIFLKLKPDCVLVFGDTNTTLAASVTAVKLGIHVAHVEAGLRSNNFFQPEEINRKITDHISSILFCPSRQSVEQLKTENLQEKAYFTGDLMYEAVLRFDRLIKNYTNEALRSLPKKFSLLTLHRFENLTSKKKLQELIDYVSELAQNMVVFPCHPNTRNKLKEFDIDLKKLVLWEPQGYLAMQYLIKNCQLVFTDSGGIQKECYFHRVRCVTLREETEWGETIMAGWNRLWQVPNYRNPPTEINTFGDGNASEKIITALRNL